MIPAIVTGAVLRPDSDEKGCAGSPFLLQRSPAALRCPEQPACRAFNALDRAAAHRPPQRETPDNAREVVLTEGGLEHLTPGLCRSAPPADCIIRAPQAGRSLVGMGWASCLSYNLFRSGEISLELTGHRAGDAALAKLVRPHGQYVRVLVEQKDAAATRPCESLALKPPSSDAATTAPTLSGACLFLRAGLVAAFWDPSGRSS